MAASGRKPKFKVTHCPLPALGLSPDGRAKLDQTAVSETWTQTVVRSPDAQGLCSLAPFLDDG
jgi:hypothetical protein